ncbi:unnamed protein product [Effrenium voratum]|uniref:beta-glucosidase n=1 Tax=Effrenium voratum TaxID=2562239 RepID=A0AA36HWG2_9DINO|nr:unnamed protein product [Effrenium voratum]
MSFMPRHGISALLAALSGSLTSAGYPEADESHVQRLLAKMTTEEKLLQTCIDSQCPESRARWLRCDPGGGGGVAGGGDAWFNMEDLPRVGIRGMRMRDGPKGMTCQGGSGAFSAPCPADGTSPSFPSQVTRAASWSTELEEEIGQAIGDIAATLDIHAALLPTINILPWLNWGRAQESYGEDPFFSGKMGAAVIRGVQKDKKVMATAKHFLANNIENTRWWVSAEMDEKTLHDVYLRAWAIVVSDSAPELVMTSYNRIQGKWAFTDPKFIDILRDQLGFDGSIMTDWYASWEAITGGMILGEVGQSSPFYGVKGFIPSNSLYSAGVDMEMPFCSKNRDAVAQAQACGDAREDCTTLQHLDRATGRILRSKLRYGLLGESKNHTRLPAWDEKFDRLILRAAHEGLVLLKNEGLLPKAGRAVERLAVLGSAEQLELGDHGSSAVKPAGRLVTVLDGLKEKYHGADVRLIQQNTTEDVAFVRSADLVVIDVGFDFTFEGEFLPPATGGDRKYLTLHPLHVHLIQQVASVNHNVVVVITSGASVIVEDFVDQVQAIIWMGYPGPLGGQALADVLAGDVNPSGKMPAVTPKRPQDYLPSGTPLEPWALDKIDVAPAYPYSHGFKHMWQSGVAPRYPFGWGLSYTRYTYSQLDVFRDPGGDRLLVLVQVTNSGGQAGLEVVQVYATCQACRKRRLPVVLVAFAKVLLQPSETKEVKLLVDLKDVAAYDAEVGEVGGGWLEKGAYDFLVGPAAQEDVLLRQTVLLEDQAFRYPGRPGTADSKVTPSECQHFRCVPDMNRIRGWSPPDKNPMDLLIVASWARLYPLAAGSAAVRGLVLLCCCRCRQCCKSKVTSAKKTS